jgi:translocator protein
MRIVLMIILCQVVGIGGAISTSKSVRDWYPTLKKPFFSPPPWVFGPVWTLLYCLMGWAGALVSHDPFCLTLFVIQLGLNGIWSYLFFGIRRPDIALLDIVLMWISIALCVKYFAAVDPLAAKLFWPYWAWVSFATLLNFENWRLNRPFGR